MPKRTGKKSVARKVTDTGEKSLSAEQLLLKEASKALDAARVLFESHQRGDDTHVTLAVQKAYTSVLQCALKLVALEKRLVRLQAPKKSRKTRGQP